MPVAQWVGEIASADSIDPKTIRSMGQSKYRRGGGTRTDTATIESRDDTASSTAA